MCGIWGAISLRGNGLTVGECDVLHNMQIAGQLRGTDGTGLFFNKSHAPNKKGVDTFYHKKAVKGSDFLDKRGMRDMVEGSRFVVGHNRAATMGEKDEANTHPFLYEHITGVHNGTVRGWKYALGNKVEDADMDSAAIFEALNNTDPDNDAIIETLVKIEGGAYALAWYDHRSKLLQFARNKERPLAFVTTNDAIWFASEMSMVEWILNRQHYATKQSFFLRQHSLLNVPLDGSEAVVVDYAEKVRLRHDNWTNQGSFAAKSAWDDEYDDTYGNLYPYQQTRGRSNYDNYWDNLNKQRGGPPKYVYGGPRDIQITTLNTPHIADSVPQNVRDTVALCARGFVGVEEITEETNKDLMYHIAQVFEKRVQDCVIDWERCKVSAPVHIVRASQSGYLYGYLKFGDVEAPVSIPYAADYDSRMRIKDVLASDHVAVIEGLDVIGLRAYHTGDMAFRVVQPNKLGREEVTCGAKLSTDQGRRLFKQFSVNHPDNTSNKVHPVSWENGWGIN